MNFLNISLQTYAKLFPYIESKRKAQIYLSILLSFIVSITESLGIGSLFPFIASIVDPNKIYEIEFIKNILNYLNINSENLTIFFGLIFVSIILLSSLLKIILLKINTKISYSLIAEICMLMFSKIVNRPYHFHLGKNSSDIVATLSLRSQSVGETTYFLISMINSILLVSFTTLTIVLITPFNILNLLIFFFLFYFLVFLFLRRKIKSNSTDISQQSGNLIKTTQETLGSMREILIYKVSNLFLTRFNYSNLKFRNALGNQVFIAASPSYVLQAFILVGAVVFAYYLNYKGALVDLIPVVAAIILAIQKLFPNVQTIFSNLTSITGLEDSLKKSLELLKDHEEQSKKTKNTISKNKNELTFNKEMEFKNVCFSYSSEDKFKIENIKFSIKKGEKIGVRGPSGCGKSTLVNLILGLLKPSSGDIFLDDNKLDKNNISSWQKKIAFVSQSIFLTDDSILENISFSDVNKKVNLEKINQILKDVNLEDYVNGLPNGINSKVGEKGSKLSGGQIQRLGIARALFKNREIIVLDEATSAMDKENEEIIFESLNKIKNLTLIIISHNEEVLKKCDKIFSLNQGVLNSIS